MLFGAANEAMFLCPCGDFRYSFELVNVGEILCAGFATLCPNIQITIQPWLLLLRIRWMQKWAALLQAKGLLRWGRRWQLILQLTILIPWSFIYKIETLWLVTCGSSEVVGPRAPVNENQVILLWVACSWPFVGLIYHRPAGSACRTTNNAAIKGFCRLQHHHENTTCCSFSLGKVLGVDDSGICHNRGSVFVDPFGYPLCLPLGSFPGS